MFHSVTQITSYWMGLVDSVSFTAYAQADAYGQLAGTNGWRENTAYTDDLNSGSSSTRPVWTSGAVSVTSHVAAVANSTASVFDITATGTIKGLFPRGWQQHLPDEGRPHQRQRRNALVRSRLYQRRRGRSKRRPVEDHLLRHGLA